jgi:hypothetical protein
MDIDELIAKAKKIQEITDNCLTDLCRLQSEAKKGGAVIVDPKHTIASVTVSFNPDTHYPYGTYQKREMVIPFGSSEEYVKTRFGAETIEVLHNLLDR